MKIFATASILINLASSASGQSLRRRTQSILPVLDAQDDHFNVIKDTRLDVNKPGILGNDLSGNPLVVASHTEFGQGNQFQGKLRVWEDGRIRYDPKKGFLGTETFIYEACEVIQGEKTSICDIATVYIYVIEDPNRPENNPKAVNDQYDVLEGQKLSTSAPGFLGNDEHEKGKPIYMDKQTTKPKGNVNTRSDGRFDYTAPKCLTGDDTFRYRVCYVDYKDMCDEATVTIKVKEDTNRRPSPPRAQNDKYSLHDGEQLDVSRSNGVLSNDRPDKGQELYVKDYKENSGFRGSLRVRSDGRVQYTPVQDKTGSFWFTYTACYTEWSCVQCRDAMVEIVVTEDQSRLPSQPPRVKSNTYEAMEDTTLEVSASNGVLSNDEKDSRYSLTVDTSSTRYNGQGSFRIRSDGRVIYTPVIGFIGTETFSYRACYKDFPDNCSSRGEGTLIVKINPSKPGAPLKPAPTKSYETELDTMLEVSASNGVLSNTEQKDSRYTPFVDSYEYSGQGSLTVRSDGRVVYTPAVGFLGTEAFGYTLCYREWEDRALCGHGSGTLNVVQPDDSVSRRGVATAYAVRWDSTNWNSSLCEDVEPHLKLSCEGEGELGLLDFMEESNNATNCTLWNGTSLDCVGENEGIVYVECRDGRGTNSTQRQLTVAMESETARCDWDMPEWSYHAAQILTFCNATWVYQGMNCTGELRNTTWGNTVCYGEDISTGATLKPETVNFASLDYESCLYL